tara:strand:- start:136 stop:426 length:291 start_codon:yes stop_codon:yes gene_type:complete
MSTSDAKVERPETNKSAKVFPAPVTTNLVAVNIPLISASPRTSSSTPGSKIIVPIPARPTTSSTFSFWVLPSIPIFCCCCLPLRTYWCCHFSTLKY